MSTDDSCSSPDPESPDAFARQMAELRRQMSSWSSWFGTGAWLCAQDIEDEVLRRVEDKYLDESVPAELLPWARTVYDNLVKSGPSHRQYKSHRRLHDEVAAEWRDVDPNEPLIDEYSKRMGEFEDILPALWDRFTDPEKRVLSAIRASETMDEAATKSGMSTRDLRTRFRRIVAKAHRVRAGE